MEPRYEVSKLIDFAAKLFSAAGCDGDKPGIIAQGLVEADLLGHTTHGLQLAPAYLTEIESGAMLSRGEPEVLADRGAAITWEGRTLPGVWLTSKAVALACTRAKQYGVATLVIRRSHHIACLAAFLQQATDQGLMITLASSDPAVASVAPYGGRSPVFTPNPMAVGIPTQGDPILIDISSSITTNGLAARLRRESKPFPGKWALDANGQPTNDPEVLFTNPTGTLLPTGGTDHGHKGYGLALMIEALTQGLGGFGRAEAPRGWGASVCVQITDPAAFGGLDDFCRETTWLAEACRASVPIPHGEKVRLPGQRGLDLKKNYCRDGVPLYPGIWDGLMNWAVKFGVAPPSAA